MIILVANLIVVVALALIDLRFVISFEVAFVGAMLVFYSSYKAMAKKISDYSVIMGADSTKDLSESGVDSPKDSANSSDSNADSLKDSPKDSSDNLPKKERFFIGFKVSFGLLRLLSYAFIALSIITLINNGAFFIIPFLLGILTSTLSTAFYAMKKAKS